MIAGHNLVVMSIVITVGVVVALPRAAAAAQTHTVQSGETLWRIAARYHASASAIAQGNRLVNPNRLALGQRLVIPTVASSRGTVIPARRRASDSPEPALPVSRESAIITRAKRLIGIPYRWGGSTPTGFDCSGFVSYVLATVRIHLPRTTFDMFAQGQPVDKAEMQVGDLLFFETISPGPSHTGLYVGDHRFVHASSGSGRVVVTSLDDRYYGPRFLGVRRFSPAP